MFAPQQQPDCMTQIVNWWNTIPFGVKFLFMSTTLIYILDFPFSGSITYFFADFPILVFGGQIWRILFCQFVHGNDI